MRRRIALCACVLLALCAGAAHAQEPDGEDEERPWYTQWRTFSLYEENDAFTGSDTAYTQGLRLTWTVQTWRPWVRTVLDVATLGLAPRIEEACVPTSSASQSCSAVSVGLGQTMFTPGDLLADTIRPRDRPYAGYLFGSVGAHGFYRHGQVSAELVGGFTGPPSLARQAQSLAHWTWASSAPRPRGWDHQLDFVPHLTLVGHYAWRPPFLQLCLRECNGSYDEIRVLDVTPRAEVAAGTLMNRASVGGTVRAGLRFPAVLNVQRIVTTGAAAAEEDENASPRLRPVPWGMVFATFDQRFVGTNALLSGTFADRGAGEWGDVRQIEIERRVSEWAVGAAVGYRGGSLMGQYVERGREFTPSGTHRFFSLTVSINQPQVAPGS